MIVCWVCAIFSFSLDRGDSRFFFFVGDVGWKVRVIKTGRVITVIKYDDVSLYFYMKTVEDG